MTWNCSDSLDDTELSPPSGDHDQLCAAVMRYAPELRCRKGEGLIDTGDPAHCFYYVQSGRFEVSYMARQTPIVVALIGSGQFFGEIGYFDRMTRTRNIRAITDATVRVFDDQVLARIRTEEPGLHARLLEYLLQSVCVRFRRVLSDRGPLTAYAAALSSGRERFQALQPLPADLMGTPGWRRISDQVEQFKARLFDIAYRLQQEPGDAVSPALKTEGEAALDAFNQQIREFESAVSDPQSLPLMWGYVFKEIFPYMMRSRFAERAYYKPKGYAGDFLMMEMIYDNQADGDGKLGRLIDGWLLQQVPARAVRSRRRLLRQRLDKLCRPFISRSGPVRIMNLACGPNRELFDFIADCDYCDQLSALCIDIDAEALQFTNRQVNTFPHGASVRLMNENVVKWAIGRVKHDFGPQDVIYSSGLCDYLDDRLMRALIKRCYNQLAPGGVLVLGNFAPSNPDRLFMDHVLYWRLIYRTCDEMADLFADSAFGANVKVVAEQTGVNLFAIAEKKA